MLCTGLFGLTHHITGSKKQSEERAALFTVRAHVIVIRFIYYLRGGLDSKYPASSETSHSS
jgi:hypothetical protein